MLHLSIRRIEVLLAVADAGSFSGAAARLGIAQPSVSEQVRALENSVGEVLLERRRGRPVQPTAAGRLFIERARAVLEQADALVNQFDNYARRHSRRVVVAAQRKLGTTILPSLLAQFAGAHPEVNFEVRNGSYENVREMLLDGTADVGYFLGNQRVADVESTVIASEPFIFVASASHPLARRKRIRPAELAAHPFIRGATGSQLTREIDGLLANVGLAELDVNARSTDDHVIRQFVEAGLSIYFAMEKSVAADLRERPIKKLPVASPPLALAVRQALTPRRRIGPFVRTFYAYVRDNWP
ncbi:HTH-type transcriptional regulator GltC [Pigmentiphaga humi]|uniref:HTH-type transcriptional regulator GltC n=1 Tax=Pigmentiphaga humi TaxID=2478468 RepID=A0A3P4B480_9BURK|nr:LysR family transcriptional regulator [Pigmentiphaga humi]VCU70490.1 HTH-type transcriptional regulator GltC [Pigmentiphaga humi]